MINCQNLVKYYGDQLAVDNLSFSVKAGEVFGLIGPNGAGKTTIIKMLLGLTPLSNGNIEIKPGIKLGYSPETPYFHSFLTAEEVLKFYGRLEETGVVALDQEIKSILEQVVGLAEAKEKQVGDYSSYLCG